jgi:hypothetical protein
MEIDWYLPANSVAPDTFHQWRKLNDGKPKSADTALWITTNDTKEYFYLGDEILQVMKVPKFPNDEPPKMWGKLCTGAVGGTSLKFAIQSCVSYRTVSWASLQIHCRSLINLPSFISHLTTSCLFCFLLQTIVASCLSVLRFSQIAASRILAGNGRKHSKGCSAFLSQELS